MTLYKKRKVRVFLKSQGIITRTIRALTIQYGSPQRKICVKGIFIRDFFFLYSAYRLACLSITQYSIALII